MMTVILNNIGFSRSQSLAFGCPLSPNLFFFFADPGALMPSAAKPAIMARALNLTIVDLDGGTHYM
ncbi:MAG: hypothetical protein O3C52_00970 [Proteobacteria bacterium]|nr:hypothetical protein [Pseudomonadota bacterium]MDA0915036.1 hypothetical protein [Pseudomonadota bacterium]MDA1031941.1 hypothetical protein [Pseudomonadota bacterium]